MMIITSRLGTIDLFNETKGIRSLRALDRWFDFSFVYEGSGPQDKLKLELRPCSSASWILLPDRPLLEIAIDRRETPMSAPISVSTLSAKVAGSLVCCITELAVGRDSRGATYRFFNEPISSPILLTEILKQIGELPILSKS